MANMATIVGAVIGITVSVIAWAGSSEMQLGDLCDRDHSRTYDCRVHRIRSGTRRLFCNTWRSHHTDNCRCPHGSSQADFKQSLKPVCA